MNRFAKLACRGFAFAFLVAHCYGQSASQQPAVAVISAKNIALEFDRSMRSRVISQFGDTKTPLDEMQDSEILLLDGRLPGQFELKKQSTSDAQGRLGSAHRPDFDLEHQEGSRRRRPSIPTLLYPDMLFINVEYRTYGIFRAILHVAGWVNGKLIRSWRLQKPSTPPVLVSSKRGSYEKRPDWVRPLSAPFSPGKLFGNE